MIISERDLNILRGLAFDSDTEPMFELLKSCLIWSDERPSENLSSEGREFLYDLWIVRGFIHRSLPDEQWGLDPKYFKDVWEFGLANVAQWPGFKRLVLSDVDRGYLAKCLKTSLSEFQGQSPMQDSIDILFKDLKSKDYRVICKAIESLGEINDICAVEAIISVLGVRHPEDNDSKINFVAMAALKKMGEISLQPTIHALKEDGNNWKRYFAAWSLGLRKDAGVIESFITILSVSKDIRVIEGVVKGLSSLSYDINFDSNQEEVINILKQVRKNHGFKRKYLSSSIDKLIARLET